MHGIIFTELRKYVDGKLGGDAWSDLLSASGLKGRMYLPIQEYPDTEAVALVTTASQVTGLDAAVILADFGEFLAPSLLGMYRTLVKPEWKTLDLLEFTEGTIHKVVRARNPGAKPAELKAVRVSATELHLTYGSQRKLCPVAKGIINGLGIHYGETITVEETQCMHKGADTCEMVVTVGAPVPRATVDTTKLVKAARPAAAAKAAPKASPKVTPEIAPKMASKTAPKVPSGKGTKGVGKGSPKAAPGVTSKAAPKVASKTTRKPVSKAAPKADPKTAPKAGAKAATKGVSKVASRATSKTASSGSGKTASKVVSKTVAAAASKAGVKAAAKGASKAAPGGASVAAPTVSSKAAPKASNAPTPRPTRAPNAGNTRRPAKV